MPAIAPIDAVTTIALLNQRSQDGGNTFRIKIYRKRSAAALPEHVATMDGAEVRHVANPETWLPKLCGGGNYFFMVFHSSDTTTAVGGHLPWAFQGAPYDNLRLDAVRGPNWEGPQEIIFPPKEDILDRPTHITMAPTPHQPMPMPAPIHPPQQVPSPAIEAAMAQFQTMQGQFAQRERELIEKERRMEKEADRRESEARWREMEAKASAREAQLQAQIQQAAAAAQVAQARPPESNILEKIAPVLVPIVQQIIQGQNDMRAAMMKQDDARSQQQQVLFQAMLQKPAIDPTVEKLVSKVESLSEKLNQQNQTPQHQMMADMVATVSKATMNMVKMATEASLGPAKPSEPPIMMAIRESVKAVQALASGMQMRTPPAAQQYQPQLPAQAQPPDAPPSAGIPPRAVQAAVVPEPRGTVVDEIERDIRAKINPTDVATKLISALGDPDMQAELAKYGNSPNELFAVRLGDWVQSDTANAVYSASLLQEIQRVGTQAGAFEPDEDEEDGDDEAPTHQA